MAKEQLAKMIADKIEAAAQSSEHPKKFFMTENGRGVVDGGDLYNAVLKDVLGVVSVALADIFVELMTPVPAPAPAKAPEKPAAAPAKASEKPARASAKK